MLNTFHSNEGFGMHARLCEGGSLRVILRTHFFIWITYSLLFKKLHMPKGKVWDAQDKRNEEKNRQGFHGRGIHKIESWIKKKAWRSFFFFERCGKLLVPGSRLLQQRTGFFFVMAVLCIQGLFLIYLICALFTYVPLLKDVIAHK